MNIFLFRYYLYKGLLAVVQVHGGVHFHSDDDDEEKSEKFGLSIMRWWECLDVARSFESRIPFLNCEKRTN